jgi:hypothetical protein
LHHDFAELLKPYGHQTNIFFGTVADDQQVLGSNTDPIITRQDNRPEAKEEKNEQR